MRLNCEIKLYIDDIEGGVYNINYHHNHIEKHVFL